MELHKAGMNALAKELGDTNAQAFLRRRNMGTPGWDFGKWLNEQPEKTDDEIEAEMESI